MNNSLLLSAKNKFGWQLNVGQIIESAIWTSLEKKKKKRYMTSLLSRTDAADRIGQK
jgi:hypothetical protein